MSNDTRRRAMEALERNNGNVSAAARELGIARQSVQGHMLREGRVAGPTRKAEVPPLPSGDLGIEELLARRVQEFGRKRAYWEARKCVPVTVNVNGPFGIHFFGDPHLDDPGNDMGLVIEHVRMIQRTEGMLGANVGDTTNNWIGRLAVKYADQETTKDQGWQLAEWFITELAGHWLFLIAGNHDLWSGSGDPLKWIARTAGTIYEPSQVRMALKASGDTIYLNCRHNFPGSSQYNPAHGPQKAAIFGTRDHLNGAGHLHKSGYSVFRDPINERVCHNFLVASYKRYDDYARDQGLRDEHISPSVTVVITPNAPEASKIHLFWDAEEGADFLTFKRRKEAA